mmetsp:Transcript_40743/g.73610  ORF Transcript_40743/g.73610 Transcript_40743/m.73610 type:complete len:460 (-) Transcript_40743:85-1464(-)
MRRINYSDEEALPRGRQRELGGKGRADDLVVVDLKERSMPLDQVQGAVQSSLAEENLHVTLMDADGHLVRTNEELEHALAHAGGIPLKALPSDLAAMRLSQSEEALQVLRERISLEKVVALERGLESFKAKVEQRLTGLTEEVTDIVMRKVQSRANLMVSGLAHENGHDRAASGTPRHMHVGMSEELSRLRGEVTSRLATLETESAMHTEEVGRWAVSYSMLARRLDEHDSVMSSLRDSLESTLSLRIQKDHDSDNFMAFSRDVAPRGLEAETQIAESVPLLSDAAPWVRAESNDANGRRRSPVRVQPPPRQSASAAALPGCASMEGERTPRDVMAKSSSSACIQSRCAVVPSAALAGTRTLAPRTVSPQSMRTEELASSRSTPMLQPSSSRTAMRCLPMERVAPQENSLPTSVTGHLVGLSSAVPRQQSSGGAVRGSFSGSVRVTTPARSRGPILRAM